MLGVRAFCFDSLSPFAHHAVGNHCTHSKSVVLFMLLFADHGVWDSGRDASVMQKAFLPGWTTARIGPWDYDEEGAVWERRGCPVHPSSHRQFGWPYRLSRSRRSRCLGLYGGVSVHSRADQCKGRAGARARAISCFPKTGRPKSRCGRALGGSRFWLIRCACCSFRPVTLRLESCIQCLSGRQGFSRCVRRSVRLPSALSTRLGDVNPDIWLTLFAPSSDHLLLLPCLGLLRDKQPAPARAHQSWPWIRPRNGHDRIPYVPIFRNFGSVGSCRIYVRQLRRRFGYRPYMMGLASSGCLPTNPLWAFARSLFSQSAAILSRSIAIRLRKDSGRRWENCGRSPTSTHKGEGQVTNTTVRHLL